jgi:hypothetical protein
MNITSGKQQAPIRAVAYGPEGIGKSTFASHWPRPLFVDIENGTMRLDVDRVQPQSWAAVSQLVSEFGRDSQGYKTLVIDTADWLEKMAAEAVCAAHGQKGIEAFGYGKGFTYLAEEWRRFLDVIAAMQVKNGMNVLFLAHACMRKFEQPDEAGAYDRWEMKLTKQVAPAMKEWADLVLFLNYKTLVVATDNGKAKAQGGQRVMYTSHHPCWDAKNRFELPDELPLAMGKELRAIFSETPKPAPAEPPAADVTADLSPAPAPAPSAAPSPVQDDPEKSRLLAQLKQLMVGDSITLPQLQAELARKGIVPVDMSPREYNVATLTRVVGNWGAVAHNIRIHNA